VFLENLALLESRPERFVPASHITEIFVLPFRAITTRYVVLEPDPSNTVWLAVMAAECLVGSLSPH